jgi:hypothetical protein
MRDEVIPFGERYSAAEYREWIRAQLSDQEQLLFSRVILDLASAWWRILAKEGFAAITDRRMFIVHADAAYSGRTRRPRFPHYTQFDAAPRPKIAREAARRDVILLPRSPDDRTVAVLINGATQRLRFRKAADASDFENALRSHERANEHGDEVRRAEQRGLQAGDMGAAAHRGRTRVGHGVKPMDFVQALKYCRFGDVTTGRDSKRIGETFIDSVERGADGALIGFALGGRPTRVVWADVEVFSAGTIPPEELPPGIPRGTKAFDVRLAGLAFLEHPDAEPSELRPPRFAGRPWFLTDYPGHVSWTELRETADRVLDPKD